MLLIGNLVNDKPIGKDIALDDTMGTELGNSAFFRALGSTASMQAERNSNVVRQSSGVTEGITFKRKTMIEDKIEMRPEDFVKRPSDAVSAGFFMN